MIASLEAARESAPPVDKTLDDAQPAVVKTQAASDAEVLRLAAERGKTRAATGLATIRRAVDLSERNRLFSPELCRRLNTVKQYVLGEVPPELGARVRFLSGSYPVFAKFLLECNDALIVRAKAAVEVVNAATAAMERGQWMTVEDHHLSLLRDVRQDSEAAQTALTRYVEVRKTFQAREN